MTLPPRAPQHHHVIERHGETVDDPYAWLKPSNWKDVMTAPEALDPEIRAHLEAEQAYTEEILGPIRPLRETLFQEMRARVKTDDITVPARDRDYLYYQRFSGDSEHPRLCRRSNADDASEELLLDADAEAARHAFYRLGSAAHSPDHALLAYTADTTGAEFYSLRIRDLASGELADEAITNVHPTFVWANDSRTLFYTQLDSHHRPYRILRHRLGSAARDDEIVYEDSDPTFYLGIAKTESRRFILIVADDHSDTSEVRYVDADRPDSRPVLIEPRRTGLTYDVSEWRGQFLILTNADGAEDFKIVQAPVESPGRANWAELIPYRPDRQILDMSVFEDWLVYRERVEGLPRIKVRRLSDGDEHEIAFGDEPCQVAIEGGFEYDTDLLRILYSSPTSPEQTIDYAMGSRRRTLRKTQEIPSGHDPERYVSKRIFAVSHDEARVPVTLLYAKGTALDGSAPLLLYGYGAYGATIPSRFDSKIFSLVDRGFVYAFAHIRGGRDCGHRWYREGKLMKKMNSFLDFIAAAECLIAERYTSAGNIVMYGGSAGGLLVGAVMNMRPDLFRAVIARVPFVDVLNTMSDPDLPLTPPEWEEWGNPIKDASACRYIASYCPYENVSAQHYPHVLATTGLMDPRVSFWEPAKWIAKLRALKTDDNLALLNINMEAGHAGVTGRFEALKETALLYAFALYVFELE